VGHRSADLPSVARRSLIHHRTPDRLHGRVFAANAALLSSGQIAAVALGGILVEAMGPRVTLLLAGGGYGRRGHHRAGGLREPASCGQEKRPCGVTMSLPAGTDIQPPAHTVSTTYGVIRPQDDRRLRHCHLWEPGSNTRMATSCGSSR